MPDVSRDNRQIRGLSHGGDQGIVKRCMFWHSIARQYPCRREVERQHSIKKRRQDVLVEPAPQDLALGSVGTLFREDASLDLGDCQS